MVLLGIVCIMFGTVILIGVGTTELLIRTERHQVAEDDPMALWTGRMK